jgi:glycosyltransferase involved in cell wall biosynthesis
MQYGVPAEKALALPHCIDVQYYSLGSAQARLRRGLLRKDLSLVGTTFLYVGRLWWGKGLSYLLDAFESVQKDSSKEVSLLLVGEGPEEALLRRCVDERGVRNVRFAGFKQKADIPPYFAASDVFVFPTLGDPYGLVVDEAMACSLPVVSTTAAGEIEDRVKEGVNGFLVQPEDSDCLANRMQIFLRRPELCEEMGRASVRMIQGRTPEKWAQDLERIVSSMVLDERLSEA